MRKNTDPGILVRREAIDVLIHSRSDFEKRIGISQFVKLLSFIYLSDAYPIECMFPNHKNIRFKRLSHAETKKPQDHFTSKKKQHTSRLA